MKITITRDEIKTMVAYKFQLNNEDFTLHISEPRKRKLARPMEHKLSLFDLANALEKENVFESGLRDKFRADKKIVAIRTLREYYVDHGVQCALFAAKAIVEEWSTFVKYCQENSFVMNPNDLPWRKWSNKY